MGLSLRDLSNALFGNYANSATLKTISQKSFINNAGTNGVSFASTIQTANQINAKKYKTTLSNSMQKIFKATFNSREDIFEAIDLVKYLDISQQLLSTIVDDAFNAFDIEEPFTAQYIGNSYNADEVNQRIQSSIKRLNLYAVFRDMVEDFITYGEYYLETPCKTGIGIIAINDTVSTKDVISVYENYDLLYHVAKKKDKGQTVVVEIDKDQLTHFKMENATIRMRPSEFGSVVGVPEVIKVGKSVLFPVLKLLQRYQLLDIASLANDLKRALMPPIIHIGTPDGMTLEQRMDMVKQYEEYFMEMGDIMHSIDASKELQPSQILQLATQVKIAPAGENNAGRMERAALDSEFSLNETQDRLIARIKSTIGVPNDDEGKTRFNLLKEKSKYAKKLIDIHISCCRGLQSVLLKDLRYQGIIIEPANLEIKFKSIQNPDVEEDAEGMFHMASSVRDVIRTYSETAEDIGGMRVKPASAKRFLDEMMSRYPQLDDMLELIPGGENDLAGAIDDAENADFDSGDDAENTDFDSGDNSGFVERPDDAPSGPEAEEIPDDEPLVEPEEDGGEE